VTASISSAASHQFWGRPGRRRAGVDGLELGVQGRRLGDRIGPVRVGKGHQVLHQPGDELGLHGNADAASLGSGVTHGTIRMDNAEITTLAGILPLGTPVHVGP
jgi:hypothetical protein